MAGQGQCRVVQYRLERKERKDRNEGGGGAGGRIWRQRKGGILEIKSSHKQERSEREEDREGQSEEEAQGQREDSVALRVGQKHSRSHLCANQPFGWLMRCLRVWKNLSLRLFGCKLQGLVGRSNNVCMCATLECKQADVLLVVPVLSFFLLLFLFFLLRLPSPSPLFPCILCYGD